MNERKMIYLDDAIDILEKRISANGYSNAALIAELNRSIGYLMQLPSAQLEIIRCKDCRHGRLFAKNCVDCEYRELATDADWFCADGERRING